MLQATDLKCESLLLGGFPVLQPCLRVLILGTTHSLQRKVSKLHMAGLCWERLGLAGGQAGLVGLLRLSTLSLDPPSGGGFGKVLRSREPGISPEKPINSKSQFLLTWILLGTRSMGGGCHSGCIDRWKGGRGG